MVYPKAFSHIGLTVVDIQAAFEWYTKVMGFYVIMPPTLMPEDDSHGGQQRTDIFGRGFGHFRLAHLTTSDGIGIELFEFARPERRENSFEFWKTGIFHLCVTDPDIEELAKRIVDNGGKQRSQIWELFPGKPYKVVYCEDPDGNIIEIYTHSYEQSFSNIS